MRFAKLGDIGYEIPVVFIDQEAFDLRAITQDINGQFLEDDPVRRTSEALAEGILAPVHDAESLRYGAPIARPSAIICVGLNYAAHAAESGAAKPTEPVVFMKTPNTMVGPNDPVEIPRGSKKTDWEVELGVVIGKRASYLASPEVAVEHIAGFTTVNDLSERNFQLEISGGQWSKGKCAPGFNPTGPYLVSPDEFAHQQARLRSWVNGEHRQNSTTSDMIFGVDYLVWHLSQFMALEPGDLLLTGTPEGVALSGRFPYLKVGDVVEVEVVGLGRQRQKFIEIGGVR